MNDEATVFRGLTRREFLAFCGSVAALIGAGEVAAPEVAAALEQLAKRPAVVWSLFQECLGCSVSLLQSRTPDVAQLILRQISLDYHEAVMAAAGFQAEKSFRDTVDSGDFFYVVEGAIATKIPGAMTVGGKTSKEIVTDTYKKAKATIAIGACATYGNIQAASPNPTGAKGVTAFLKEDAGIANPVVINIARCPGNAEDMIAALAYVLLYGKLPPLDVIGRPLFLYGQLIHDQCERRAHFEAGEFIESFGDAGAQKGWCWYKMGCKGPITYAPCPTTRWNGHLSWCVVNGPCTGCSEPAFWDNVTPFQKQAPAVLPGVSGVSAETIGYVVGGAAAVGLAAHAVGQVATGRWGHGAVSAPPHEEEDGASR
jgi:hydrogenase small subunit